MNGQLSRPRGCVYLLALNGLLTLGACEAYAHGDHGGGGGTVLPAGVTLVSVDYDYIQYNQISDARLTALAVAGVAEVHSLKSIAVPTLSLAYGVTRNFTIAARLPYLANREIRETDVDNGTVNARGGVYGLGDLSVTGTYRFVNNTAHGFTAAAVLGLKAPTGRTNAYDKGGEILEVHHQPGSGSWDPLLGGTVTQQLGQFSLSANALYAFSTEGSRETTIGDRLNYGVAASYRLWESGSAHDHAMHLGARPDGMMRHGGVDHAHAHGPPMALDVSLGLNGFWSDKVKVAGEVTENTGGNVLYLTPGLRMTIDQWAGYVNVGIPVAHDLTGIQSDPKFQLTSGVSVRF